MAYYINKDTYVGDTGKQLKDIKTNQQIIDLIYPVGSIFLTINKVNPGTFLGGTWEQVSGGYLYASTNSIDKTSYTGWGTQSHTLTEQQIPSHKHTVYNVNNGGPVRVTEGYGIAFQQAAPFNTWGAIMNMNRTGGGQGHSHDLATCDVFMYKRTA